MKRWLSVVMLALLVALGGCDDGDRRAARGDAGVEDAQGEDAGQGDSESDAHEVDPNDRTPPTIVALSPDEGSTDVPLDTSVSVEFDEIIDAFTVTEEGDFTLEVDNEMVAGAVRVDDTIVTFSPSSILAPGVFYEASISSLVTDLAGNHLGETRRWSFSTMADEAPPEVGTLRIGEVTDTTVELTWDPAGDDAYPPETLTYTAAYSLYDNIADVEQVGASGTAQQSVVGELSAVVTGLDPETRYFFNVVVEDGTGKRSAHAMVEATTASPCDVFACDPRSHCELDDGYAPTCVCDAGHEGPTCQRVEGWFGLGQSELGPWSDYLIPDGVIGKDPSNTRRIGVATTPSGEIYVGWSGNLLLWDGAEWGPATDPDAAIVMGRAAVFTGANAPVPAMWDVERGQWIGLSAPDLDATFGTGGDVFQTTTNHHLTSTSPDGATVTDLSSFGSGSIQWTSVAVDSQNRPVVAFDVESSIRNVVRVARLEDTGWVTLVDGSNQGQQWLYKPEVAIGAGDEPIIRTGGTNIVASPSGSLYSAGAGGVERYDGDQWERRGPTIAQIPIYHGPGLAFDSEDNVVIAYRSAMRIIVEIDTPDGMTTHPIGTAPSGRGLSGGRVEVSNAHLALDGTAATVLYVADLDDLVSGVDLRVLGARYEDHKWETLPTLALDDPALGLRRGPAIATSNGVHTVYWVSNSTSHLSRLIDGAWVTVDHPPHQPTHTALAIGAGGIPVVAWSEGPTVHVEKLEDGGWVSLSTDQDVAAPLATPLDMGDMLTLSADESGHINVAWNEHRLSLWSYRDGQWRQLAGPDEGLSASSQFRLTQDQAGDPMVASYFGRDEGIELVRWSNDAWEPFGGDITSVGSGYIRTHIALHAMADGNPLVAYGALAGEDTQIFAKRWNGQQWASIFGSAEDRGISNSFSDSDAPQVATSDEKVCVLWMEKMTGQSDHPDALVRCAWLE